MYAETLAKSHKGATRRDSGPLRKKKREKEGKRDGEIEREIEIERKRERDRKKEREGHFEEWEKEKTFLSAMKQLTPIRPVTL